MTAVKPVSQMTNEEFLRYVVEDCLDGWVPLKTYLRLFPEETKVAVESRIKRRYWQRYVHYNTPEGSNTWVNLKAIRQWVLGQQPTEVKASVEGASEPLGPQ